MHNALHKDYIFFNVLFNIKYHLKNSYISNISSKLFLKKWLNSYAENIYVDIMMLHLIKHKHYKKPTF